jgi:hypothetical protein
LHIFSGFHELNLSLELGAIVELLLVPDVELLGEINLLSLLGIPQFRVLDIGKQLFHSHILVDHAGGMVFGGRETIAPKRGAYHDLVAWPENDISRWVLVRRTQNVEKPGAYRWPRRLNITRVRLQQSRFVIGNIRLHGPDNAAIVDYFRQVRQDFGYFDPTIAVSGKFERRGHKYARFILSIQIAGGVWP